MNVYPASHSTLMMESGQKVLIFLCFISIKSASNIVYDFPQWLCLCLEKCRYFYFIKNMTRKTIFNVCVKIISS